MTTPFELDIAEQPAALRRLAEAEVPTGLDRIARRRWDRIVLTGMGSSHFAGIPTWRRLVALGLDAWSVDASALLDAPELITPDSLVIATSQSGASGEVVELLDRMRGGGMARGRLVGIAADETSPLADASDVFLPLHSGDEATVSTKSYLNTLAVHRRIAAAFAQEDAAATTDEIAEAAGIVERQLAQGIDPGLAQRVLGDDRPRVVAVGKRDDAATALYAALITKESSKVAMEGYVGGQFRHGPFELAGDGMTAFLYGAHRSTDDGTLSRLADDLVNTGARVVLVGDLEVPGAMTLAAPGGTMLAALSTGAVVAELFAVDLARANGVEPGAFAYGSKVTTAL